jgi:integrase
VIPLPTSAVAVLREHRQEQLEEKLASGGKLQDEGPPFTNAGGGPVDVASLRNRDLRRIARKAKTPEDHFRRCEFCTAEKWMAGKKLCREGETPRSEAEGTTLFGLRHKAASGLVAGGVHVRAVRESVGHASTALTHDGHPGALAPEVTGAARRQAGRAIRGQEGVAVRPPFQIRLLGLGEELELKRVR